MGGWEGALGSGGGFSFLYLGRGGIEGGYPNWLIWTFFGFGGPQNPLEQLLQQGKDELKKRISERKRCADVFGGKDKALKALSQLKFSPGTLETGIMQINGNNVTVDQNRFNENGRPLALALNIRTSPGQGAVVSTTSHDLMALILTGKEFAAFAMGHELGHKRKIYGEYDNDGGSYSNLPVGANNEKLRAACFDEFAPQEPPSR